MNKIKVVIGASLLAALSIMLQYSPLFFPYEFIRVDLVGMPWILSSLVFGLYGGMLTSLVTAALMLFTPTGFIGAFMKLVATLPIVLIIGLLKKLNKTSTPALVLGFVLATAARLLLTLAVNLFWAIPAFFGLGFEEALAFVPVIVVGNILAAVVEFAVAALLFVSVLKSRLGHYLD